MPFVSFEGVDGSGKSTQLDLLAEWLETRGETVTRTKEPDGGRLGPDIRTVLTRERGTPLSAVEELLLVSAARYDHVRSVVEPALAGGRWVLSDRFADSTFALQVYGGGAPPALFHIVNEAVIGRTRVDLTFILDLDPAKALARRRKRTEAGPDPAELTRDFDKIAEGFRLLAGTELRCRLIDASRDVGDVAQAVRREIISSGLLQERD